MTPPLHGRPLWSGAAIVAALCALSTEQAHAADPHPLCGTTLTTDLVLTEDLDCTGYTGVALTVGADGLTIDGQGFRLLAPDASQAIAVVGMSDVTVQRITLSGWCVGVGLYAEGADGLVVDDVVAEGRSFGADIQATTGLTLRDFRADAASSAGLRLQAVQHPIALEGLTLTNNLVGLQLHTISGPLLLDPAAIDSLAGNDVSIWFEANNSGITVRGLDTLDGWTYGIQANALSNSALTFDDLDVSGTSGNGTGIWLGGAGHRILAVTADSRQYGVYTSGTTDLEIATLNVARARTIALYLGSPAGTLALTELDLRDSPVGLEIANFNPATAWPLRRFDAGAGAITSLAGCDTGLKLSATSNLLIEGLTLDNPTFAIDATATSNHDLVFRDLTLTAARGIEATFSTGLHLGGARHLVEGLTAARRFFGVRAEQVQDLTMRDITIDGATNIGLYVLNASGTLVLDELHLTHSNYGLYLSNVAGTESDPIRITPFDPLATRTGSYVTLASLAGSDTGIGLANVRHAHITDFLGAHALSNRVTGINASGTNNANLTFEGVDLSGPGAGSGLILGGSGHALHDVQAHHRATGLSLSAPSGLVMYDIAASGCTYGVEIASLGPTHTAPDLQRLDLRNNNIALRLLSWTLRTTFDNSPGGPLALVTDGSDRAIEIESSSDLTFEHFDLSTRRFGIWAATGNARLTFRDIVMTGSGNHSDYPTSFQTFTNYGLTLQGADHVVEHVTANRFGLGFRIVNASKLTLRAITAHHNDQAGLYLAGLTTAHDAPTLDGLDLRDNASYGLWLDTIQRPLVIDETIGLDVSGSAIGIGLGHSSGVEVSGLTLDNPWIGIDVRVDFGTGSIGNVFEDLVLSGAGDGTGIRFVRFNNTPAAMDEHELRGLTIRDREIGINFSGGSRVSDALLEDLEVSHCQTGIVYNGHNTTAVLPPRLVNVRLNDNELGLSLSDMKQTTAAAPFVLDEVALPELLRNNRAISITRSAQIVLEDLVISSGARGAVSGIGVVLASSNDLTLHRLSIDSWSLGIHASAVSTSRFEALTLSGHGAGVGMQLGGADNVVQGVTVHDRETGLLAIVASNLHLQDLVATGNGTGLRIQGAASNFVLPTLVDLDLDDNGIGLDLETLAGTAATPFVIGPTEIDSDASDGEAIRGCDIGIQLATTSYLRVHDLAIDGRAYGIKADATGNLGARFDNLTLSGHGHGYGLRLRGADHRLTDLTANDRQVGVELFITSNPNISGLDAARAWGAGLLLTSTTLPLALSDLALTDSALGLSIATVTGSGSVVLDGGEITSLAGDATAITLTSAPQITVDAALGLTPSGNSYLGPLPPSDPLCGTTLTSDLSLSADLDCRGTSGTVFTIGDDDVTLDGNGFAILAPHASRVVSSAGHDRLTVREIDLSGAYAAGTGVDIGGGSGHLIQGVVVDRRQRGVWIANTSALTLSDIDAREARTTGVQLETLTLPLTLVDLDASGGLGTGVSINGLAGAGPGGDLIIDGAALTDLSGNDVSLALSNTSDLIIRGPITGLDGATHGIAATTGNTGLSFEALDLSASRPGIGRGLDLGGDAHRLVSLIAHRRSTAFDVQDGAGLVLDDLAARHARSFALSLENTPAVSLTDLKLTDSTVALRITDHAGSAADPLVLAPFAAGAGAIGDLSGSAVGIQILRSSHIALTDLALDNPTAGVSALDAGNADLTFRDLDLTGARPVGVGIELGGGPHLLEDLDVGRFVPEVPLEETVVARRARGISLDGTAGLAIARVRVDGASDMALAIQRHSGSLLLTDLSLTRSATCLRINGLAPPSELVIGPYDTGTGLGAITSLAGCEDGISLGDVHDLALVDLVIPARDTAIFASANTSSLRFEDLDLDGIGIGTGLSVSGTGHELSDIDASRRGWGVAAVNVSELTLTRLTADRSYTGLFVQNATMPLSLDALELTRCHTGLDLDGVVATSAAPFIVDADLFTTLGVTGSNIGVNLLNNQHVHVQDLHTLTSAGAGLRAQSNNVGLVLQRLTVSGHGRGYGVDLSSGNVGARVSDVIADHRATGFLIGGASALRLERSTSRGSGIGLRLYGYNASHTPPTLFDLDLRDNVSAINVTGLFSPALILSPALGLDLSGSSYAISVGFSSASGANIRIEDFVGADRLQNRLGGISANQTGNADLVIDNVDVSGHGVGSGLVLAGTGHQVIGLTADDRSVGLDAYARGLTLRNVTARRAVTGVRLHSASPSFPAPIVEGLDLQHNLTALELSAWTLPFSFGPSAGLVVAGSKSGVNITGTSSGLTFEGPMALAATSVGIVMSGTASGMRFRDLDLSGRGQGTGIAVQGTGHELLGLTANDRATGVQLNNAPGVIASDIAIARASTAAVRIINLTGLQAPPQLSDLRLTDSAFGLLTENMHAPLSLDPAVLTLLTGNRVALSLFGSDTTVSGLSIASSGTGVIVTSTSPSWGSHSLAMTLEDLILEGSCRGTGVDINNASYTTLDEVDVARFATGVSVGHGDGTEIRAGVVGANVTGLATSGGTAIPSTVVRTNLGNSTTQVFVTSLNNITNGMPLRFALPTGDEDRVVLSRQVSNVAFTLSSPLSMVPPQGTTVRGLDYGTPRLVVETSDVCANGTGMALAANVSVIEDNYWRASDGPEHATLNPSGSGDLVTGTAATLSSWLTVPADKDNPYCNQAPLPDAGTPQTVCQGDLVTLDATASSDPDVEPLTYQWTQTGGVAVALADEDQAQASFTAPAPANPADDSEVLSFQVHVADDEIERSATVTVTTTRGHEPPSADAGADQTVARGSAVTLAGARSDPEAQPLAYTWVQTAGPAVTLADADQPSASFTAPPATFGAPDPIALTFVLTVGDTSPDGRCGGVKTADDTVTITVVCPDSDGDQTSDCQDACPLDPNKLAPGNCGCGVPEDEQGVCGAACGNGVVDVGEACDPGLDDGGHCDATTCQCGGGYAPDGGGGCTYCGDALVNGPESCEDALDVGGNCAACQCGNGYAPTGDGGCGYCGDGALAEVEACDDALDTSGACVQCLCTDGWVPAGADGCAFCGEGMPSCETRVVFGVASGPQGLKSFRCQRAPDGALSCATAADGTLALSEDLVCR